MSVIKIVTNLLWTFKLYVGTHCTWIIFMFESLKLFNKLNITKNIL